MGVRQRCHSDQAAGAGQTPLMFASSNGHVGVLQLLVQRGFDVRVGVPFDESLADGRQKAADKCVEACATGALAARREAR